MDTLLVDIKNFLKKLESGQLDIEAGQWELHKDIANMKKSVEELKKLKEDVEVMRMSNIEQKELIKNLEAKLEMLGTRMQSEEPVTMSQSSVEYETVYRVPANEKMPPKGYKKRKCHRIRSEEIIEITSNMSDKKSMSSNSEESLERHQNSQVQNEIKNEEPSDNSNPNISHPHVEVTPMQQGSKARYQSHPGNAILQRYLKDSVRYRDREMSNSSELTRTLSNPSHEVPSKNDTECSNFWDEYGSRQPRAHLYRPATVVQRQPSTESQKTTESVMPKRLVCSKSLRKSNCKSEFLDQEPQNRTRRFTRSVRHIYRCGVCGKGFSCRNLMRMHRFNHQSSTRKVEKGFKCSYCDKVCSTPENLTFHLRNCRIITRSHFKRR